MYRLILSDLDGTLLNSKSEATDDVKKSIAEIQSLGVHFALCSGRAYESLSFFEKDLGLDKPGVYGIGFNGGVVYETFSHKILLSNKLKNALALEIVEELQRFNANILVYIDEKLYAEKRNKYTNAYSDSAKMPLVIVDSFKELKLDFSKVLLRGEYNDLIEIEKALKPKIAGRANSFFSSATMLEFSDLNAHKGYGLEFLAKYLGIAVEDTIAVGDQINDLTMLKSAGLGIAVKNAVDEAKAAADAVLDATNDENAIGRVLELFIKPSCKL
jgi:Cof subfamily protein (haloacid dehalogenase superfamily)